MHGERINGPPVRMYIWAALLSVLTFIGFLQSPHVALGTLNFIDVRQATTQQALAQQDVGLLPLLASLAPLVAALGVLGAVRYRRRYWLLLVLFALGVTLPTAAKTYVFVVVFTAIVFYLLCREARHHTGAWHRGQAVVLVGVALVTSLVYFVAVDTALNKDVTLSQELSHSWLPSGLLGPIVYEVGGLSALSVAQTSNVDPRVDNYGRSVYAVPWALRFITDTSHKPQTIAYDVAIPIPFNVFTGFGDIWFDYGWIGVFGLGLLLGSAVSLAYRRWSPRAYQWAIVSALLSQLLASMTISFRLFYLETLLQLAVGYIAFRHIAAAGSEARMLATGASIQPVLTRPRSHWMEGVLHRRPDRQIDHPNRVGDLYL